MVQFSTIIKQFDEQGEKTGWTYIDISHAVAEKIKPGNGLYSWMSFPGWMAADQDFFQHLNTSGTPGPAGNQTWWLSFVDLQPPG